MDELGENLLLAPNEQVCLLFEQHDALKVKEEMEIPPRDDIMVIRYDSASSASNSPSSSLTPSPQRDLSPSSSESCEDYPHFSNSNFNPAACVVNVEEDDEDVKEEEEDLSNGCMTSFMKNGSLNMNDNTLFNVQQQGTDKQRKRKRINKVTFVGETNIMWEDYIPTENPVLLFQDNQILYVSTFIDTIAQPTKLTTKNKITITQYNLFHHSKHSNYILLHNITHYPHVKLLTGIRNLNNKYPLLSLSLNL